MTHEELLAIIKEKDLSYSHPDSVFTMNDRANKALRAVVELHKPFNADTDKPSCSRCMDATTENGKYEMMMSPYPCETIRTIEKELM